MIKNQKQAAIAKDKLAELINERESFLTKSTNKESAKFKLGLSAFDGLINEIQKNINDYDSLVDGNFHCLNLNSLEDISNVLISARLAQKMSQKELGELIGIKEQQIQRYEATDYESASWPRIIEVSIALKLKFYFKKIILMNSLSFDYPDDLSNSIVENATKKAKQNGLLNFV